MIARILWISLLSCVLTLSACAGNKGSKGVGVYYSGTGGTPDNYLAVVSGDSLRVLGYGIFKDEAYRIIDTKLAMVEPGVFRDTSHVFVLSDRTNHKIGRSKVEVVTLYDIDEEEFKARVNKLWYGYVWSCMDSFLFKNQKYFKYYWEFEWECFDRKKEGYVAHKQFEQNLMEKSQTEIYEHIVSFVRSKPEYSIQDELNLRTCLIPRKTSYFFDYQLPH